MTFAQTMRQTLEGVGPKLETLYEKLRHGQVSPLAASCLCTGVPTRLITQITFGGSMGGRSSAKRTAALISTIILNLSSLCCVVRLWSVSPVRVGSHGRGSL